MKQVGLAPNLGPARQQDNGDSSGAEEQAEGDKRASAAACSVPEDEIQELSVAEV